MKTILDLCGGTGSWSAPYKKAGYKVINVTLPKYDVNLWNKTRDIINAIEEGIYGILAAPPCTQFSFARTNAKEPRAISALIYFTSLELLDSLLLLELRLR